MALGLIYRASSLSRDELAAQLNVRMEEVQEALDVLLSEGRVQASDAGFRAAAFVIEEDSEHGWEAAAFDHFQAVAKALANKVYLRSRNSEGAKLVSGTTLHFDLTADHPLLPKVLGLLAQTRELTDAVWDEVFRYNELHAVPDENRVSLTFYLGRSVRAPKLVRRRHRGQRHQRHPPDARPHLPTAVSNFRGARSRRHLRSRDRQRRFHRSRRPEDNANGKFAATPLP